MACFRSSLALRIRPEFKESFGLYVRSYCGGRVVLRPDRGRNVVTEGFARNGLKWDLIKFNATQGRSPR